MSSRLLQTSLPHNRHQEDHRMCADVSRSSKMPLSVGEMVERATGVEPATSSLGSWHSTTELRPPAFPCPIITLVGQASPKPTQSPFGAGFYRAERPCYDSPIEPRAGVTR